MDAQNSGKKTNKKLKMVFLLTPCYSGHLIILLQEVTYFDCIQFLLKSYISCVSQSPELEFVRQDLLESWPVQGGHSVSFAWQQKHCSEFVT